MRKSVDKSVWFFALLSVLLSSSIHAQTSISCGDLPEEPAMIDGKTASMEDLVTASKAVTDFIANADTYLDCQEKRNKQAKKLSEDDQAERALTIRSLLNRRNAIGDEFNAQIALFREANPDN